MPFLDTPTASQVHWSLIFFLLGYISMHKVQLMALNDQMRMTLSPRSYRLAVHASVLQIDGKSFSLKLLF